MKFLPWDYYDIQTSLNLEQVVELLRSKVEPRKWLRFSRHHKTFGGKVTRQGFKIRRIIDYSSSLPGQTSFNFPSIIHGSFVQGAKGIDIKVRMRLHPFVIAFMCVCLAPLGLGICMEGLDVISGKNEFSPLVLIPRGLVLFGWLLVSGIFSFEAKKGKGLA